MTLQEAIDTLKANRPPNGQAMFSMVREALDVALPVLVASLTSPASPSPSDICSGCGGPYRFDTSVPSVLWNRVIRAKGLPDYLCTTCIVEHFARAGVSFTAELFGDNFAGTQILVRVAGAEADTVALLNEENNALRHALLSIAPEHPALLAAQRPTPPRPLEATRQDQEGR